MNDALAAAPGRWANLTVLDYARVAAGRRDFLLEDLGGGHLSGPGALAWADIVKTALDARFPA